MKAVQKGFTLVEVCLVMLIFGVAISSRMALFPVSLRQGSQAVSDSVVAAFGDYVMNALAGRASAMQGEDDWQYWKTEETFKKEIVKDVKIDTSGNNPLGDHQVKIASDAVVDDKVSDYLGLARKSRNGKSGQITIRYRLEIDVVPTYNGRKKEDPFGKKLYRAILHVTDNPTLALAEKDVGRDGKTKYIDTGNGLVFVTFFSYLGEVP